MSVGTLPNGYYGTLSAGSGLISLSIVKYSGWNHVSTVHFNTTSTGGGVTGNITNSPMLVRLDSNNFIFDQAMPDGWGIGFDPALPFHRPHRGHRRGS